jgi:hypothetical protein
MEYSASIVALKAMEALLPLAAIHYERTKWFGQTLIGPGVNFLKPTWQNCSSKKLRFLQKLNIHRYETILAQLY